MRVGGEVMQSRFCPSCRREGLVHTGAFWACEACGHTVTTPALLRDESSGPSASSSAAARGRAAGQAAPAYLVGTIPNVTSRI